MSPAPCACKSALTLSDCSPLSCAEGLRACGLVLDREPGVLPHDFCFDPNGIADGLVIAGGQTGHGLLVYGVELHLQLGHSGA